MNNYITIVFRRQGLFAAGSTLDDGGARTTHEMAPRRRRGDWRTQKQETFNVTGSVQFALL